LLVTCCLLSCCLSPVASPMQKALAELFGTFCLVFAGTGAIIVNDISGGLVTHVGVAITFGLVVMAMIYAIGDVSGAHINPAVTLGFWLSRRLPRARVLPYIAAQLAGAFLASFALFAMFPQHETLGSTFPAAAELTMQAFVLELVMTMILMFVILAVATGPKEKGVMAGIAIGGVIGFEAMFGGPISGASMNPARSLAPAVFAGHLQHVWIYLIAPVLGATLATLLAWGIFGPRVEQPQPLESA
jgi:MIP family channel proteins